MRIFKTIVIFFICVTFLKAQKLSVEEVSSILGEIATQNVKNKLFDYPGEIEISISTTKLSIQIDYCWNGNEDITFESEVSDVCNSLIIDLNSIKDLKKVRNEDGDYIVQAFCKSESKDCISFKRNEIINYYYNFLHDDPESRNHYDFVNIFYFSDYETQELLFNGMRYLAYELIESNNNRNQKASSFDFAEGASIVKIDLTPTGGVSSLPINMSGVHEMAILDSGASDVSLPASVEYKLKENGVIAEDNYLPSAFYVVADGRTILSRRFIVPKIEVEGVSVKNVRCSVNESEDIILLGKAFLNAFKSWSVDNENNQLILKY